MLHLKVDKCVKRKYFNLQNHVCIENINEDVMITHFDTKYVEQTCIWCFRFSTKAGTCVETNWTCETANCRKIISRKIVNVCWTK